MKKLAKIVAVLVIIVVAIMAALATYIATLDADKYRPQLVQTLTEKTGRKVALNGPIGFSLGLSGVTVSIKDAAIGNPAWASRSNMASLGKFQIGVGVLPLLAHKIEINTLVIENADIQLETNARGQKNWEMGTTVPAAAPAAQTETAAPSSAPAFAGLSVGKLSIIKSRIAMRNAEGKVSSYDADALEISMGATQTTLTFKGNAAGTPVTLTAKTGSTNLLSKAAFPFDADLTYGAIQLTLQGKLDLENSKVAIDAYRLAAGKSAFTGSASAAWGGTRPSVRGVIEGDGINFADFAATSGDKASTPAASSSKSANGNKDARMFSTDPLPLDGLKAADANFDVSLSNVTIGQGLVDRLEAKLTLVNGLMSLSPFHQVVGKGTIDGQMRIDASQNPARMTFGVRAANVDIGDLQKLGSMSAFMSGKAAADIQLSSMGNSMHALASSLGGVIVITTDKGEVSGGALAGISSALSAVFNPKGGDSALNCMAARFIVKNGLMTDNGILIDTSPSTVVAKGSVNLSAETVDMTVNARTKLIDLGGLVPSVKVGGALTSPSYSVDAVGGVANAVSGLLTGQIPGGNGAVPQLQTAPAGQNACVYTLDHPQVASKSGVLPADAVGKASQSIQNIGNSIVKGLFGN